MVEIQEILFLVELLIQVVVEVVGLLLLLISKTSEVGEELVVIDVLFQEKTLVVVPRLNLHLPLWGQQTIQSP